MSGTPILLNAGVAKLVTSAGAGGDTQFRLGRKSIGHGKTTVVDFGIEAPGGLDAGLVLARVCMANLATIQLRTDGNWPWPTVEVLTDHPVLACLASQYAGWEIKGDGFFAMGSGPMRAVAAREPLFDEIGFRETIAPGVNDDCFGVLESSKFPPESVCLDIAGKCGVEPKHLTLLVAPTRSLAGTMQIVARSIETALHKLHELKFDLTRVQSAFGSAPLPPPASDDFAAIGRTNDAILYGGRVTLYVRGDDASLAEISPQVPSKASRDFGRPFAEVLSACNGDFYRVDPLLFSPAEITFANLDTGHSFRSGAINREVLEHSFAL